MAVGTAPGFGTATAGTATDGTPFDGTATAGTPFDGTATDGTATAGTPFDGTAFDGTPLSTAVGFDTTAGTVSAALLLAHQGGWDEMLLVAGPIGVVVFLIRLARKRADAIETERNGLPADLSHGDPSTGAHDADAGLP